MSQGRTEGLSIVTNNKEDLVFVQEKLVLLSRLDPHKSDLCDSGSFCLLAKLFAEQSIHSRSPITEHRQSLVFQC